jgi:hypothetical protein
MIPPELQKWLSNPNYGSEWQDMDLVLADVEFLPRLKAYFDEPTAPKSKKAEVVSALLELLEHECMPGGGPATAHLAEDIKSTIRQHKDICQAVMSDLGPIKEVVLRSILALPIPPDFPRWLVERARQRGA